MTSSSATRATGGKWTPEQILAHDPAWLRELGLELDPRELWRPEGGGVLEAVVQLNEASASSSVYSSSFVSPDGLLLTTHHCIFGLLQEHSSLGNDLLADGFLAADRSEELVGTTTSAAVPYRFEDVTAAIEGAVAPGVDDSARYRAIDRKKKELVTTCEGKGGRRCRVAVYDDGVRYVLIESLEFRDVRLVYAPPRRVGDYGGKVDFWSWPRHSGDFALLRVYAGPDNQPAEAAEENRPYRPRRHLQLSLDGVRQGGFVMAAGYPGITYRSRVAEEMAERTEDYLPRRIGLYRDWRTILEATSADDGEAATLLTGRLNMLSTGEKNLVGKARGVERGGLLAKKRALEAKVLAWATEREEHRAAVEAHRELTAGVRAKRRTHGLRDFLLQQLHYGPLHLMSAVRLTRWAQEREKPDLERRERYQERHRKMVRRSEALVQKRLHPPTERRLLEDFLGRMYEAGMPAVLSLIPDAGSLDGQDRVAAYRAATDRLLAETKVLELSERMAMFDESVEELRARRDPLLDFAFELNREIADMVVRRDAWIGALTRLRPVWRRAVEAYLERPLAPDANGTLRVSLAHIEGYRPRDGVWMEPRTRLAGVVEKHTGDDPFDAPPWVLEGAADAPKSRWADPELGDVPVCFLSTGDITGGSSGSPILDGRGRLVGVNVDQVWENVANDFGYDPSLSRNICADVRFLLWLLERTPGSEALLEELGAVEFAAGG